MFYINILYLIGLELLVMGIACLFHFKAFITWRNGNVSDFKDTQVEVLKRGRTYLYLLTVVTVILLCMMLNVLSDSSITGHVIRYIYKFSCYLLSWFIVHRLIWKNLLFTAIPITVTFLTVTYLVLSGPMSYVLAVK